MKWVGCKKSRSVGWMINGNDRDAVGIGGDCGNRWVFVLFKGGCYSLVLVSGGFMGRWV